MTELEKTKIKAFEVMREMADLQGKFQLKNKELGQLQKEIEELEKNEPSIL